MSEQKYDIVDATEDAARVGYSIGAFACKYFYQVSSLSALKDSMDAYVLSRFSQRLEYFTYEHNKLSVTEKKAFYDDLKSNKQNLNYLYDFVEKARTTTYELHAKIYAILSARLVKNKNLSYFESNLLANIHLLTEKDINYFAFIFFITNEHESFTSESYDENTKKMELIPYEADLIQYEQGGFANFMR